MQIDDSTILKSFLNLWKQELNPASSHNTIFLL